MTGTDLSTKAREEVIYSDVEVVGLVYVACGCTQSVIGPIDLAEVQL